MKVCDEATYKLYKAICRCPNKQERYNIIKEAIAEGAQLQDNDTSVGTPLIYAIYTEKSIDIIKLLVDAGGVDFEYETYGLYDFWFIEKNNILKYTDTPFDTNREYVFFDRHILAKKNLYNMLVYKYMYAVHKHKDIVDIINTYIVQFNKNYPENIKIYECTKYDNIRIDEQKYKYICDICNIIGLDINIIKDKAFEMLEDIFDEDFIPDDEYPYNFYE